MQQRRSAQLRARVAANKLLRVVYRSREQLLKAADKQPCLLRPDSTFIMWWKYMVLGMVVIDVAAVVLAPEDGKKLKLDELAFTLIGDDSCAPKNFPGPRQFGGLIGPRALVRAPLPEHCLAITGDSLTHALALCLGTILQVVVGAAATCDVVVEFFTGAVNPTRGTLEPKPPKERYFLPPFSLVFNIVVNPALASLNSAIVALLTCGNPYVCLRLVVSLQPILQHAEAWATPRLRALFRTKEYFSRRRTDAELTSMASRSHLLAAKSAARLSDSEIFARKSK